MSLDTWLLYLAAAVGLSLTPGPNGLLALTHGAIFGTRRTLFTIAGGAVGFLLVIAVSMFGIGALITAEPRLLTVLSWGGGAYLIWLGVQVWRSPPVGVARPTGSAEFVWHRLARQGFLSAASNPKAILFFVAFLPPFLDPDANLFTQFLILGGTFAVVEFLFETVVARTSQSIQPWLARAGRRFNRFSGGLFMVLGVVLPLQA